MELTLETQRPATPPRPALAFDLPSLVAPPIQESLAAYVAHELRTPLAIQHALLELALADSNADVAAWRETGEDVLHACRQQERLLEACLTLARSEHGLQQYQPLDLGMIAATTLRAHDPGGLELLVALEPAQTSGDPDLVERLVANLVSNAIRHNIAGGRIEIATHTEAGRAILSLTNTCGPIPVGEVDRLFEPFQRLDTNPRTFSDGVGLGLAIVRAIADAHNARLTARARSGGGLAINVAFPTLD